jgi:3-hydroxyacyl-CoA dehydrogenase
MQCDAVVAAFESYPGLVESGVGLIPAGGGCKEFALRAASCGDEAMTMRLLTRYFQQIAQATVASSAPDALKRGFLRAEDHWVMHAGEVLFAAKSCINHMQARNYTSPIPSTFPVMGRSGHALLQAGLVNWLEGGFISEHDYFLSNQLASVLCGGDVEQGQLVDENWILRLEREAFIQLAMTPESQAKIKQVLNRGV